MGDLLRTGLAWLTAKRHADLSQSVTLRRGATERTVNATPSRQSRQRIDEYGTALIVESYSFLFRAADYEFGAGAVKPASGDEIDFDGRTFLVIDESAQTPYRDTNPNQTGLRVWCKLIG